MKIQLRTQSGWAEFENAAEERCDIDGAKLWIAPHDGLYCDRLHTPEQIEARFAAQRITTEGPDPDAWRCLCGNTPSSDGFFPCDEHGNETEPTAGSNWTGLYGCGRCGRIIRQGTLEIVGQNPEHTRLA